MGLRSEDPRFDPEDDPADWLDPGGGGLHESFEEIVMRHAKEDRRRSDTEKRFEAVAAKLNPSGDSDLTPPDFHVFTKYLFAELPAERRRAVRLGTITLGDGRRVFKRQPQAVAAE